MRARLLENLTDGDLTAPAALRMKAAAEARLADLRQQNDADADPATTARLRGRIAECKDFLAAWEPSPPDLDVDAP